MWMDSFDPFIFICYYDITLEKIINKTLNSMKKQLILGLGLVFILSGCGLSLQNQESQPENSNTLTTKEAKAKAKKFIDDNLLAAGQSKSQITSITEEKGLFKIKVQVEGQSIDSYMTKDGKKFFPQAVNMDNPQQASNNGSNSNNQQGQQSPQAQQPQEQMTDADRANAMIRQGNMLLDQAGDSAEEADKQNLEQKIQELEELNNSENPNSSDLQQKMQEVQQAAQPLLNQMSQQQNATGTPANPQE